MASETSIAFGAQPFGERERLRAIRLTATASLIGTTIEWYDFILYTSLAGLIFNKLFFPADNPVVSLLLAYATFAVGFLTRPIGGAFFGHFGDRLGRKPLLVLTLTMMGVATFLIGLVPTYAAIGVAAPIMMVVLRLIQGFAMGGEWGGAVLMAFEYAPPGRRGFYACFPQIGFAIGLCLSTGAITLLSSLMSNDAFLAWGWRCAFYVSILLLAVGLFVRLKLFETPEFERIRDSYHVTKLPIGEVARKYRWNVVLGWLARMGEGGMFTVYTLYMLPYLTGIMHLPRTLVLSSVTAAALVLIFTVPLASAWSDRVGRRRLFGIATLVNGLAGFPLLWMLQIRQSRTGGRCDRDCHRHACGRRSMDRRRRCSANCSTRPCAIPASRWSISSGRSSSWRRCRSLPRCWSPGTATSRGIWPSTCCSAAS